MSRLSAMIAQLQRVFQHPSAYLLRGGKWLKDGARRVLIYIVSRRVFSLFAFTLFLAFIIGGALLSTELLSPSPSHTERKSSNKNRRKSKSKGINMLITNQMSDWEYAESFDKEIESFMRRWEITGGSFALMRNDSLLYAKGYGYADKEGGVKCDVSNTLRIASASKLITATAAMKLIEQGKLSLTSKVFGEEGILNDPKFLELQDSRMRSITVEHLLRHTAGFAPPVTDPAFSNYSVAKALGKGLPLSVDDMVLYATKYKLNGKPGDRYKYSNLGYIILGRVIEEVSGESYEKYVQESLFEPIECYNMYIGENFADDRDANEVHYYEVKEAELVEAYDGSGKRTLKSDGGNNVSLLSSAGGWVASPVELLRFVASIDGHSGKKDQISSSSIAKMTTDSRKTRPIGWATIHGEDWIRSGSMAGTCTIIKRQRNGYTWIFVTNSSAWIGYRLGNNISSHITRAISKVKRWPKRDMFRIRDDKSQGELK